jgi:hypothetical protein
MTSDFSLGKYPQGSLLVVYSEREEIQLDPAYQRIGGIWTPEKRQLLVDSLLNNFDVPKLYFHEFVPPKRIGNKRYRYAIIDGKQRLQAIWDFIDGKISLADDFEYLRDDSINLSGLGYSQLAARYPHIKSRFDATVLDITTIRTDDLDLIEDMFSRLNEAVPLNAPEKRNAFGGPLPPAIRRVAGHVFFAKHVPFTDKRYRHRDLAAKFMFIEYRHEIVNTKKGDLDNFVRDFKQRQASGVKGYQSAVNGFAHETERTLALMNGVFGTPDSLLRQVGMVTLYYHLFRLVRAGRVGGLKREMLSAFEKLRDKNRQLAEQKGESDRNVDLSLLEFDKHSQTPNDAYALRIRLAILLRYLNRTYSVTYDKTALEEPR